MTVVQKRQSEARQQANPVSAAAKEAAIEKYLPLVRFVAEKVHRRLPPGVDLESLSIQA
jgi:DNA-directed RNA polymerase specialized sigma subunit